MCINSSRLIYTTRGFSFRNRPNRDNTADALDFYLKIDSDILEDQYATGGRTLREPNKEFSKSLHYLRSSGYVEYIFELTKHLDYHVELVDLMRYKGLVYVYKLTNERVNHGVLS